MGILSNIKFKNWKSLFIVEEPEVIESTMPAKPAKSSFQHRLKRRWTPRLELKMKTWRSAVAMAEDPLRPRRVELYGLYHTAVEDEHFLAQMRTARFTILLGEFMVMRDNTEVENLKPLFEKIWFKQFLRLAIDTEFYGHSLIEFHPSRDEHGEFQKIFLLPREHVHPEDGEIVLEVYAEKGIPYRKGLVSKYLVELGQPDDLGLLKVISKIVTRKDYSINDWDTKNEKYGMPFLIVRSSSRDEKELDKKEEMAAGFGSNSYAILDDGDEVELLESKQVANGHLTFKDRISYCDEKISMLVNGQTGTTDEKAFVGSAEVHERILNDYTLARMSRIESEINFCLIPFLIKHGYTQLQGAKFHFADLLKRNQREDKETSMEKEDEKKKLKNKEELHLIYQEDNCCEDFLIIEMAFDIDGLMQAAIKNVFDKQLKAGDIHAKTWQANVEDLWSAVQEGVGKQFVNTAYTDSSFELLSQFKNNIHVFSAFKNHSQTSDMVDLLKDANGQLRTFKEFQVEAQKIYQTYNQNWLRAEHTTAIRSGQMAVEWQSIQEDADLFPYLIYKTQEDSKVRLAHQNLNDVCKPVNDPFWDSFFPPNGWSCRCYVERAVECSGNRDYNPPSDTDIPQTFRHNAGKTTEIFGQEHPYFQAIPNEKQRTNLLKGTSELVYKNYDQDWQRRVFDKTTGGYIVAHIRHGKEEIKENLKFARRLMADGKAVELVEDRQGVKSPDALLDGLIWEFKTVIGSRNCIQNNIKKAKKQAPRILLKINSKNFVMGDILRGLMSAIRFDETGKIKLVAFWMPDNSIIQISRKEIEERNFKAFKNYLK